MQSNDPLLTSGMYQIRKPTRCKTFSDSYFTVSSVIPLLDAAAAKLCDGEPLYMGIAVSIV
jgi:hypothetical protein